MSFAKNLPKTYRAAIIEKANAPFKLITRDIVVRLFDLYL